MISIYEEDMIWKLNLTLKINKLRKENREICYMWTEEKRDLPYLLW